MKRTFLVLVLVLSVFSLNGAEIFYSDGTSVPIKKSEELSAVKTEASDASAQKGEVYRMTTGRYVYSFVSGRKDADALPVYFFGGTPTVAERTVFWRGEKSLEYMEKKYGMKLTEIFPTYPLYSFSVKGDSVEIAEKIVKNGDGYAFPDLLSETALHSIPVSTLNDPYLGEQWHLNNTGTANYHYSNADINGNVLANADIKFTKTLQFLNSKNINVSEYTKIAIMDTGVDPNHEDLTKLDTGWNAIDKTDGGYPDSEVSDTVDHGTKCAGISAAAGNNNTGMSGVCPWCGIYPVKWLTGHGSISHLTSDMLTVYEKYVADPNITTINCSFGPSPDNGPVPAYPQTVEAIQNFMKNGRNGKGGVVVYSSGNDAVNSSYNKILEYDFTFERNGVPVTDRVVTVNASTAWDTLAEYSNYGYASTVIAPSLSGKPYVGIATTAITGYGDYPSAGGDYTRLFSGTSAAAPVVSGLFGMIFSINPNLTLEQAIEILKQSADKIYPETGLWEHEKGFSVKFGYGRINLEKAARLAAGHQMCAEIEDEEICGNHLDDDCDGYVDEGCVTEELTTGKPCETDEDCRQPGSSILDNVTCATERLSWVFKGGYCLSKSYAKWIPPYDRQDGQPCPDGTRLFDKEGTTSFCALECNKIKTCKRTGYYCSDEVLGICLPRVCSEDSDCDEGYFCNEDDLCVPSDCGNGEIDEDEECDNGTNNGQTDCAYGQTGCKVCTTGCKEKDGNTSYCGDSRIDGTNGEKCDNGTDNGQTDCPYGQTSCELCTNQCLKIAGNTSYCGDSRIDRTNGETCDNGTDNGQTDCAYGQTSCELCTNQCLKIAGNTSYCGDGNIDASNGEACDNGTDNGQTDCAYGQTGCKVCTLACREKDGNTSYCGDGNIDASNGEACDNGTNNGQTDCAYGQTGCKVCTTGCKEKDGNTSYCGDSRIDGTNGEKCDNGTDNGQTDCPYGQTSCELCTNQCLKIAGNTSYCGDSRIDRTNGETCDNGTNNGQTDCAYGQTGCKVCTTGCKEKDGNTSYCGDGVKETANGENCDNGTDNGQTDCAYGQTSCELCSNQCLKIAGNTSYCGDGVKDAANGENCDDGNTENGDYCSSDCKTVTGYCGDGKKQNNEACDDGTGNGETNCAYGETSCELCTTECTKISGATSYCGDGTVDAANNEACDDAFNNGRTDCAYGEYSCFVCTTECLQEPGAVSYCGDGHVDTGNGEICDDGGENGTPGLCNTACSGTVAEEIPDDNNPDEDTPDSGNDENQDENTPDGETTDDNLDDGNPDTDETTDSEEIPDNEEKSDSEELPDSSEKPDEGGTTPADNGTSPDEDKTESDDVSGEPAEDTRPAAEKKSGGCSVIAL